MKKLVLGFACLLVLTPSAWAIEVPVQLDLIDQPSEFNLADLTATGIVTLGGVEYEASDTDTAVATGNMLTNLTLTIDPSTRQVTDVSGLEFTGGLIEFSNVAMSLDFVIGTVEASSSGLQGTFDTPNPPKPVVNDVFQAIDHEVTLNQGQFDYHATGQVEGLVPAGSIDLSDEPITPEIDQPGTLTVALKNVDVYDATYEAILTLPLEFEQEIFNDSGTTIIFGFPVAWTAVATVSGSGTLRSVGQFTITSPAIPGDATKDGVVDALDARRLAENWLKAADWEGGDFNGDDIVDDLDASILAANWNNTFEGVAAVPEPSSLAGLIALLATGLWLRARRK
ncbi:MAG: PEP-CTERM sorting domain-containing protein [Pirellulales bacterium]|nr:PEP-CTERM sorting domain-containing protein [Pirellulales bacterium]